MCDGRDYDLEQRVDNCSYAASPKGYQLIPCNVQHLVPSGTASRGLESPIVTSTEEKDRFHQNMRDRELNLPVQALPPLPVVQPMSNPSEPAKASRKQR
jgi:hypothetical protein